ncbi:MAG: hypothetical protein AYL30_004630 [Candidatus Hecatellales archaeon B24]|nr:MAG: hypothetical protein AYL30_004630 [Candidatus Hecatellales archaeon B24]
MEAVLTTLGFLTLNLLVYPGFIFTSAVGLFLWWELRKLTARFQWRVGPPVYQTFADLLKLLSKESIVPAEANRLLFVSAPIIALSSVCVAALLVPVAGMVPLNFAGDVIVLIYLLIMPSIMIVLAGSASANPFGAIGSSREMNLAIAYELAVVVCLLTLCLDAGSLHISNIVGFNFVRYPLAAVALFLSVMAKLCLNPFEIPEAKTEIMAGPYTEYSGRLLGLFKLTYAMLLFILSSLLVSLFFHGPSTGFYPLDVLVHLAKCMVAVFLMAVVAAVNPRLRIDQALRFFWGFVFTLALFDFVRAFLFSQLF